MSVNVYLSFNGNCKEAVEYYAEVFQTRPPVFQTFGQIPPEPGYPIPEEVFDKILFSSLIIEGSLIMFSDTFPGSEAVYGNNISLAVDMKDETKLRHYFHMLRKDGDVSMELQETYWSKCYGMLTDKFGITWQFSLESS